MGAPVIPKKRSSWTQDDADAVDYLLQHRQSVLTTFECDFLDSLQHKAAGRDSLSQRQRDIFDEL